MKDNFVILDIETNVQENSPMEEHFHVIQIGAIKITDGDFKNHLNFNQYIRPVNVLQYPVLPLGGEALTDFIQKLTKIQQETVNHARAFPDVWEEFLDFCDPYFEFFVSWGLYDWEVLQRVCKFYDLNFPFRYHVNLKDYYKTYFEKEEVRMGFGVKAASEYFGLVFNAEGAHNGYEDTKMITAIAEKMIEKGFYTFKKGYYEFKVGKIVPCEFSNWLISPVLVKKYKEMQKRSSEMEQYLFAASGNR